MDTFTRAVFVAAIIGPVLGLDYRQLFSKSVGGFDEKFIEGFARPLISGVSLVYCHAQCLTDMDCMSFFYGPINGTCRIHQVVFFNPEDGDFSGGLRYYIPFQDMCPSNQGYIYSRSLELCYKFHFLNPANYSQARKVCQIDGGDLIIADTEPKLIHIGNTIMASTFPISSRFLIGATDEATEGEWRWLNGQSVAAEFWMPGKPSSGLEIEDYATIHDLTQAPAYLNDIESNIQLPFICQFSMVNNNLYLG